MFRRALIPCFLLLSFGAHPQGSQVMGSICGTLQDENGQPSAKTFVVAHYLGAHSGPMPGGRTDERGHYCVNSLGLGDYAMSASDEDRGYPDLSGLFFAQQSPPVRTRLTAASPNGLVDVQIPYKAGWLGILLSDSDGNPVKAMNVKVTVRSDPDRRFMRIGTSSNPSQLLLPPNEYVYVTVTSPGYSIWPEDGSKGLLVNLLPGEKKMLKISLRKDP